MFLKSLLVLAICGVPLISEVSGFNLLSTFRNVTHKIDHLGTLTHSVFNEVKGKWGSIMNEVDETKSGIEKSYHITKNQTLKLIRDAKEVYTDLKKVVNKNYGKFQEVYKDLNKTLRDLEGRGGKSFNDFKDLLNEIKINFADMKSFVQTGDFGILKKNYQNVKVKYDSFKISFDLVIDTAIVDVSKTQNDVQDTVTSVQNDSVDLLIKSKQLFDDAKKEFHSIMFEGKKNYDNFQRLTKTLKQSLEPLKKLVPDKFKEVEGKIERIEQLVEKEKDFTTVAEEAASIVAEEAAEVELADAVVGALVIL